MLRCPKCDEELKSNFNKYQDKEADYIEVELVCLNGHSFFCRIRKDDIIEDV